MSLQFNDTTSYKGIIQQIEKECGFERGDISSAGNDVMKEWTADVNLAWDEFMRVAFPATGTWQFDDTNHANYPIIKSNLVSGQRDYPFTSDEGGNLILDVFKVAILPSATATTYQTIDPLDVQSEGFDSNILAENTTGGTPTRYDKTANSIFLDPVPNYNATNGIKIYINREASYFAYTDTSKQPGVPGHLHEWFSIVPALKYAGRKALTNYNDLLRRKEILKGEIQEYFNRRSKDEQFCISNEPVEYE